MTDGELRATLDLADFLLARIAEDEAVARDDYRCNTDLRWTPARMLAECEAKRRLIALQLQRHAYLLLALPYADHPDYNEDWRV